MSHEHKGNPVATYIITALILGVITYFEFAIVEYEISWLSRGATIFWLVALSIIKFIMVVAIFMHLKDDERTYTGFFSSGMLMALATFIILPLLFTVSTFPRPVQAESEAHAEAEEGLDGELRELIESDGYSRSAAALLDTPRPKDRSLMVEPPAAAEPQGTLTQEGDAQATGEQEEEEAPTDELAVEQAKQAEGQDSEQPAGAVTEQAESEQAEGQQAEQEQPEGGAAQVEFDRELGQSVYASTCAGCHGPEGAGMAGVFPPLAGNLPQIHNAGGREYLIDVVIHGLTGPITVAGQTYNGAMPAWGGSLSNEQIAAVLNHGLTAWGNEEQLEDFTAITPDEVEPNRGEDPGNLNERRAELMGQ